MAKTKKTKSVEADKLAEDRNDPKKGFMTRLTGATLVSDHEKGDIWEDKAKKEKHSAREAGELLRTLNMRDTFFYPRCHKDVLAPLEYNHTAIDERISRRKFIFADNLLPVRHFEAFLGEVQNCNANFRVIESVGLPWDVVRDLNGRTLLHANDFTFEGCHIPEGKFFVIEYPTGRRNYIFFLSIHPLNVYENLFNRVSAPEFLCIKRAVGHGQLDAAFERWNRRLAQEVRRSSVMPRYLIAEKEPGNFWPRMTLANPSLPVTKAFRWSRC